MAIFGNLLSFKLPDCSLMVTIIGNLASTNSKKGEFGATALELGCAVLDSKSPIFELFVK